MARPRKEPEARRDEQLKLRLTTAERSQIEHKAAAFGLSAAEFMRRRALGYALPPALEQERTRALQATALVRLGVNLNQIAKHMNAGRSAPAYLVDLIERIERELDNLYDPGSDTRTVVQGSSSVLPARQAGGWGDSPADDRAHRLDGDGQSADERSGACLADDDRYRAVAG